MHMFTKIANFTFRLISVVVLAAVCGAGGNLVAAHTTYRIVFSNEPESAQDLRDSADHIQVIKTAMDASQGAIAPKHKPVISGK